MMVRPGVSVALYLPSRSTIHSSPCGTIRTPFHTVTTANISSAMTTISSPMIPPCVSAPGDLQKIAFDREYFYALTGLDFLFRDRIPYLVAQHRLLQAYLSLVVGADIADYHADLADQLAL